MSNQKPLKTLVPVKFGALLGTFEQFVVGLGLGCLVLTLHRCPTSGDTV